MAELKWLCQNHIVKNHEKTEERSFFFVETLAFGAICKDFLLTMSIQVTQWPESFRSKTKSKTVPVSGKS
jgi:hypothetical protein